MFKKIPTRLLSGVSHSSEKQEKIDWILKNFDLDENNLKRDSTDFDVLIKEFPIMINAIYGIMERINSDNREIVKTPRFLLERINI